MTDTVSVFMSRDHDRLDVIFAEAGQAGDASAAGARFGEFDRDLRRHIEWEEEILFPVFEERTGMVDSGPTAVMRMEHDQIARLLDAIALRISEGDASGLLEDLAAVLRAHNTKEEMILYPWMDEQLSAEEIAQAMSRIASTG